MWVVRQAAEERLLRDRTPTHLQRGRARSSRTPRAVGWARRNVDLDRGSRPCRDQYSPLITKNEPRMVPASLDFCLANLNREASSAGTSIPSASLNPTARLPASSSVYSTLIDRPLS